MSLNILKKQVKYCFLDTHDEELVLLRKKITRTRNFNKKDKQKKKEDTLRYFELQDKYKTVSKNVIKHMPFKNK